MKYYCNKILFRKRYFPYLLASFCLSVLVGIVNRLYNTLSKQTYINDILIALFVLSVFISIVLVFVYGVLHKKYKKSYIQIHNGKIKYKNNSLQNTFSEYSEFPYYKEYIIDLKNHEMKNSKLILFGDITLNLLSENMYIEKTRKKTKLIIIPIYDDWAKIIEKIDKINMQS